METTSTTSIHRNVSARWLITEPQTDWHRIAYYQPGNENIAQFVGGDILAPLGVDSVAVRVTRDDFDRYDELDGTLDRGTYLLAHGEQGRRLAELWQAESPQTQEHIERLVRASAE